MIIQSLVSSHSARSTAALFVTTLLALGGCTQDIGPDAAPFLLEESVDRESVIVGTLNWQEVTALADQSPEREQSRAVGYLSIPARGTRCTGFLVGPDLVMTNEHCIPDAASAQGVTLSMRREAGVPSSQWDAYSCATFVGNSRTYDYALLRCTQRPGDTYGVVTLESRQTRTQESLYVIHQNCDYFTQSNCSPTKKISRGQVVLVNSEVGHNADTLGGSSGSPVFAADTHGVFALHHVGIGGNSSGRGSYNKAVPMRDILADVASRFPSVSFGGSVSPPPAASGDAFEPNDDAATATTAAPNASGQDLTITSNDRDVFRVEVTAPGALTVDLAFSHAAGDLDVELFQGSLSNPRLAKSDSATDNEQIALDVTLGTYFVVVYGYQNAQNQYDIAFSFVGDEPSTPPPAPTGAEPNDSLATASSLSAPAALSGVAIDVAGDDDFYAVDHPGGILDVTLEFSHAAGDLDLYLYRADGTEIGRSNGVTNTESIRQNVAASTVFIRVTGYQSATGAYDITLQ